MLQEIIPTQSFAVHQNWWLIRDIFGPCLHVGSLLVPRTLTWWSRRWRTRTNCHLTNTMGIVWSFYKPKLKFSRCANGKMTFILTQRGKKTSWSQFHHGLNRICLHEWKMIHRSKSMGFFHVVLFPRWSGFSRTDVLILKTLLISHHLPYVCIGKLLCMQGYEMLQEFQSTISGSLLGYLLSGSWPKGSPYVIILCHILKFSE